MKLIDTKIKVINEFVRLSATVERNNPREKIELYFEYSKRFESFLCKNADPFVPALLIPCMLAGERLTIRSPISQKLLRNLATIQDIFTRWYPGVMKRVEVEASQVTNTQYVKEKNVGAFFSLGVDSFYTLLKNIHGLPSSASSINHLIFINGVEAPLAPKRIIEETCACVMAVADATKKECVYGETNIRNVFPIEHEHYYAGACLASVALSLSSGIGCVLIPSHSPYSNLNPSGTHVLLDHLWSTEQIDIIHDGCEVNRSEKVEKIVNLDPSTLNYLRTCTSNDGKAWNCGECKKCLRTMLSLQAIGFLDKSKTYPHSLPKNFMKKLSAYSKEEEWYYTEASLELACKTNKDIKLIKELHNAISTFKRKKAIKMFLKEIPAVYSCVKKIKRIKENLCSKW